MYSSDFEYRVRYGDTDKMGYLYYGNYPRLYEIGRVEYIRALGLRYRDMEDQQGIILPVVSLESRYRLPVYYDELITIRTILKELPTKMISFHHEIYNEKMQMVNSGVVKLFFVEQSTGRRVSCPDILIDKISPYFER